VPNTKTLSFSGFYLTRTEITSVYLVCIAITTSGNAAVDLQSVAGTTKYTVVRNAAKPRTLISSSSRKAEKRNKKEAPVTTHSWTFLSIQYLQNFK